MTEPSTAANRCPLEVRESGADRKDIRAARALTAISALAVVTPLLILLAALCLLMPIMAFFTLMSRSLAMTLEEVIVLATPLAFGLGLLAVNLTSLRLSRARTSALLWAWPAAASLTLWLLVKMLPAVTTADSEAPLSTYAPPVVLMMRTIIVVGIVGSLAGSLLFLMAGRRDVRQPAGATRQAWPELALQAAAAKYSIMSGRVLWQAVIALVAFLLAMLRTTLYFVVLTVAAIFLAPFVFGPIDPADLNGPSYLALVLVFLAAAAGICHSLWHLFRRRGTVYVHAALIAFYAAMAISVFPNLAIWQAIAQRKPGVEVPYWATTPNEMTLVAIVLVALLLRPVFSGTIGKRLRKLRITAMRGARQVADRSDAAPVLLLRSFDDDDQCVARGDAFMGHVTGNASATVRIEELVEQVLFPIGPLVALANPDVKARPLGASRDVASHDDWQGQVLAYVRRSQMIIVFVGNTPSLGWEFDQIIDSGRIQDILVVFPEGYLHDRFLSRLCPRFAEMLGIVGPDEEKAILANVRALAFDWQAGRFAAFKSLTGDEFAYTEAIRWCAALLVEGRHLRLLERGHKAVTPPVSPRSGLFVRQLRFGVSSAPWTSRPPCALSMVTGRYAGDREAE